MATSTMAPAWCSALARADGLVGGDAAGDAERDALAVQDADVGHARAVALVVQAQALQGQRRVVHVGDVGFGQDVVGQAAGGDHQRVVAQLAL